jgi:hypothetical protein
MAWTAENEEAKPMADLSASSSLSSTLSLFRLLIKIFRPLNPDGLIGMRDNQIGQTEFTSLLIIILDFNNSSLWLRLCTKSLYFGYDFIIKLIPGLTPAHELAPKTRRLAEIVHSVKNLGFVMSMISTWTLV